MVFGSSEGRHGETFGNSEFLPVRFGAPGNRIRRGGQVDEATIQG